FPLAREADHVEMEDHWRGGVSRPAVGRHDVHGHELHERMDHGDDEQEESDRREKRKGDGAELLPRGGAVDGGGLVVRLVDVLQSRQKYHHEVADIAPYAG